MRALSPAEPAIERQLRLGRSGLRGRERAAEDGVRAEPALPGRPVQVDENAIEHRLIGRVETEERLRDLPVHIGNRGQDTLAEVRRRIAVPELDGLVLAGRRARRHCRAPEPARGEADLDLDGRIAARVENLTAVHIDDGAHSQLLLRSLVVRILALEVETRPVGAILACELRRALDPLPETTGRRAQRELRIHVQPTRDVDDGEEHVPDLGEHLRVGLRLGSRLSGSAPLHEPARRAPRSPCEAARRRRASRSPRSRRGAEPCAPRGAREATRGRRGRFPHAPPAPT